MFYYVHYLFPNQLSVLSVGFLAFTRQHEPSNKMSKGNWRGRWGKNKSRDFSSGNLKQWNIAKTGLI